MRIFEGMGEWFGREGGREGGCVCLCYVDVDSRFCCGRNFVCDIFIMWRMNPINYC